MNVEHLFTAVPGSPLRIAVSRARPDAQRSATPLLYVHGGTFPSELAIGFRIDGVSWRDALLAEGYEVWAFDLLGYGASDRYPEMTFDAAASAPLGRADFAARQLAAVVTLIQAQTATPRVSLIAHSWGSMVAGSFAARCPWAIERLVFFGPVLHRQPSSAAAPAALPGWARLTVEAQRQRFVADLPQGQPPAMKQFERWAAAYLASEPDGGDSVRIPTGPMADIDAAWRGSLAYDPALIAAPICVLRGEWDSLCRDDDVNWLLGRLPASLYREDVKLARGTHLMHLETGRMRLYDAAHEFLYNGGTNGKLRRNRRDLRGAAA